MRYEKVTVSEPCFRHPWAYFFYRTSRARFVPNSLWNDLSPVEWLLGKMGENLQMQNATWLVSRELAEAAGPWDENLQYDQDGEYFTRVLIASEEDPIRPGRSEDILSNERLEPYQLHWLVR